MRTRRDLPTFLQQLHTDEYDARPVSDVVRNAVQHAYAMAEESAARDEDGFWNGRHGTAAGLIGLNEQFDAEFYAVPPEALEDPEAADEALGGDEVVIDVQTHYVADRDQETGKHLPELYRNQKPSWWTGLDGHNSYSFAEYLRCVFLETENAVAVLSSSPGVGRPRAALQRRARGHPPALRRAGPARPPAQPLGRRPHQARARWSRWTPGWSSAGPRRGRCTRWASRTSTLRSGPACSGGATRCPASGTRAGCSTTTDMGAELHGPRRGARARRRSPHHLRAQGHQRAHRHRQPRATSALPRPRTPTSASSPTTPATRSPRPKRAPTPRRPPHVGTNRLVKSLRDAGLGPRLERVRGARLHLVPRHEPARARPRTCSARCCSRWARTTCCGAPTASGTAPPSSSSTRSARSRSRSRCRRSSATPALTPAIKDKILSRNAARLYGIDLAQARHNMENDDLAWLRDAYAYYLRKGSPS